MGPYPLLYSYSRSHTRPARENYDRQRQPSPPRNRARPLPARPHHPRSGCVLHMRGNPFPATWSGSRYKGGALHDRGLTTHTGISLRLRIWPAHFIIRTGIQTHWPMHASIDCATIALQNQQHTAERTIPVSRGDRVWSHFGRCACLILSRAT